MNAPSTSGTWPQRPAVAAAGDVDHIARRDVLAEARRVSTTGPCAADRRRLVLTPSIPTRALASATSSTTAGDQVLDVARHVRLGQRLRASPSQPLGRRSQAGAAPAPAAAVVLLEPVAQRARRLLLQLGVDGGADRQAAAEELVLAEVPAELAADLVGEVVARRQLLRKPSKSPFCTVRSGATRASSRSSGRCSRSRASRAARSCGA